MNTPTANVTIAGVAAVVVFDVARLLAIESTMDQSLLEIGEQLQPMLPASDSLDGKVLTIEERRALPTADLARLTLSEAEGTRVARAFRANYAIKFIAACLGRPVTELQTQIAFRDLVQLNAQMAVPFYGALNQLAGDEQETPAGNAPASPGSSGGEPGPESNSASPPPSLNA